MVAKILIVDDEFELCQLMAKRIRSAGFDVECYFQGESAVSTAMRIRPSLILLDIKLPEVSGTELYLRMRKQAELRCVPIIFISAMHKEADYCLNVLGAEGFIRKPFDSASLLFAIRSAIDGRNHRILDGCAPARDGQLQ